MGGILSLISNALGVLSGWLGIQSKRLDLKNAPDVKAAAVEQDEADAVSKTNKAIASKDVDEIRKELAE